MKKSVRRVLIIVMAMMCCLLVTVPVSAAKKPSMKTVTRTYRKFLKKHIWNSSRYTSQGETTDTLVDINKDGVPELVVQYPNDCAFYLPTFFCLRKGSACPNVRSALSSW